MFEFSSPMLQPGMADVVSVYVQFGGDGRISPTRPSLLYVSRMDRGGVENAIPSKDRSVSAHAGTDAPGLVGAMGHSDKEMNCCRTTTTSKNQKIAPCLPRVTNPFLGQLH